MDADGSPNDVSIGVSHQQAGSMMADHLVQRGYRQTGKLAHNSVHSLPSHKLDHGAQASFSDSAAEDILKTIRNALLVSSASTGLLFAYYLMSGKSDQIAGLWVYAIAMFFGVFGYLLFAGGRHKHKHRK